MQVIEREADERRQLGRVGPECLERAVVPEEVDILHLPVDDARFGFVGADAHPERPQHDPSGLMPISSSISRTASASDSPAR